MSRVYNLTRRSAQGGPVATSWTIDNVALPLRTLAQARGESLYINLCCAVRGKTGAESAGAGALFLFVLLGMRRRR